MRGSHAGQPFGMRSHYMVRLAIATIARKEGMYKRRHT